MKKLLGFVLVACKLFANNSIFDYFFLKKIKPSYIILLKYIDECGFCSQQTANPRFSSLSRSYL